MNSEPPNPGIAHKEGGSIMGDPMKTIFAALVTAALMAGCVSGTGSQARPPNYVASQANQSPAFRNDNFGGAAMPRRGLPH
jgi:hypothetical protein